MASMGNDPIRWILSECKATQITGTRSIGGGCINRASRHDSDAGSFFVKTNRSMFLTDSNSGFTTKQMVNPWKTYVKLSAVLMGSNGLTKGSLDFLNYPAQIMFKSTKMKVIPVMIIGSFIPGLRRKCPPHEYLSAVLLVVGLILFTLADTQTSPNFSVIGVLMVCGALIMDSFLGNLQEAISTMNPETTQTEMLFCSTLVGMPFFIPPTLVTGELFTAWTACSEHLYVYGVLVFEAMATFIGQVSFLSLIALFGGTTTAMITTARKAITLLLSYMIFTKPLTDQHGSGVLLIAMAIVLKMMPDYMPSKQRATSNSHAKIENIPPRGDGGFRTGIQEDEEKRPFGLKHSIFERGESSGARRRKYCFEIIADATK